MCNVIMLLNRIDFVSSLGYACYMIQDDLVVVGAVL